ncbi:MAG: sorbosone dehydrogenase family protein [Spirochaetales bacterium]|nr:sorbosone dehydrogenase family protein [Spirochaetales bacterium]
MPNNSHKYSINKTIIFLLLWLIYCIPAFGDDLNSLLNTIRMPAGFSISVYAENVPGARSMTMGDKGTLFVGTRREGKVYAITDTNADFKADKVRTILTGLNMPNGVAFRKGALYVAEVNRILKLDNIEENLDSPPKPSVIIDTLPSDRAHGWKYITFGPDNRLYIPVGFPCNVCEPENLVYGSLLRINPDGSGLETFASGIRNTVGFAFHPVTKELWFTDNGRDWLGDDKPPDELNHAPEKGLHFGFPYLHGKNIRDPDFGSRAGNREMTRPVQELGPHVAALGMKFYTGGMFPGRYKNNIFIAEHGSWNRSIPIGYRITFVKLKNDEAVSYTPFAEGWLKTDGTAWGRPVDLLVLKDGSLLVSDDKQGAIYRIIYK